VVERFLFGLKRGWIMFVVLHIPDQWKVLSGKPPKARLRGQKNAIRAPGSVDRAALAEGDDLNAP